MEKHKKIMVRVKISESTNIKKQKIDVVVKYEFIGQKKKWIDIRQEGWITHLVAREACYLKLPQIKPGNLL